MAERMKAIEPQGEDNAPVEIVVENPIVLSQFKALKPRLMAFLQKELDNGQVDITFRVRREEERHRAFSDKEKLEVMVNKSTSLEQLINELNLELV